MHAITFDIGADALGHTRDLALESLQSLLHCAAGVISVLAVEADGGHRVTSIFENTSAASAASAAFADEPEWARAGVTVSAPARVHSQIEHIAGQVRHIRASIPDGRIEEVTRFWRNRGRAAIESAPGCLRARGFIDPNLSEFVVVIWWRSHEDAEALRLSDFHEVEFLTPLGPEVIRLGRSHLDPIDD